MTAAPALVPGLKLWVKADAGVVGSGSSVATWQDQSGNGNHLVQPTAANQPQLVPAQANGLPVLRFDGAGDYLSFTTRLTTIRSVFWVIKRAAAATPGYRFLLGDPTNYHFCPDSTTKIWTASYTSPAILNGETRLNGALINGTTTDRPTALSVLSVVSTADVTAGTFSKDRTSDYSWWGDLAELIIFDRAVTPGERESIESYLAAKYALYTPKAATPTIEPAGGSIASAAARPDRDADAGRDDPLHARRQRADRGVARLRRTLRGRWRGTSSCARLPERVGRRAARRSRLSTDPKRSLRRACRTWRSGCEATPVTRPTGPSGRTRAQHRNSLVQTAFLLRPSLTFDATSRMPLLRFDGAGDYMDFRSG